MRRYATLALISLPIALASCAPDFGDFLGDTSTYGTNPNAPIGSSENMRRVRGLTTPIEPLVPEPGNVWPGPVQLGTPPTLGELERNPNLGSQIGTGAGVAPPSSPSTANAPDHRQPRPRGSSTPPGGVQPGLPPSTSPDVINQPQNTPPAPPESGQVVVPNTGPAGVTSGGNSNYKTLGIPGGGQGILVPNGNGTSTLIKPDGTVSTVPNPR